jgi:hypothetical protein
MACLKFFSDSFVGFLGEGFSFRKFGLRLGVFAHGLVEAGEAPMDLYVGRREMFRLLEIVEGRVVISSGSVEDA